MGQSWQNPRNDRRADDMPDLAGFYVDGEPLENAILTRLERIEKKVDDFGTALITLAKTEERVLQLMKDASDEKRWMLQLQNRITELEKIDVAEKAISRRVERMVWAGITAAFSIATALIVAWLLK